MSPTTLLTSGYRLSVPLCACSRPDGQRWCTQGGVVVGAMAGCSMTMSVHARSLLHARSLPHARSLLLVLVLVSGSWPWY